MDGQELMMKRVLTIAGSDSGGGAGIQADLKTFAALGVHGMTAITAVTAQNSVKVGLISFLPPDLLEAQIRLVAEDIGLDAVKIGMLGSLELAEQAAMVLKDLAPSNIVLDPVLGSSSGDSLFPLDGVSIIRGRLLPLARVVTPNLREAGILVGRPVQTPNQRRDACRALVDLGCSACVLTGGHLEGRPMDLLFDGTDFFEFDGERISRGSTHGTGCTFSAAMAAYLAKGTSLRDAVAGAKKFVATAIRRGPKLGRGAGPLHQMEKPP